MGTGDPQVIFSLFWISISATGRDAIYSFAFLAVAIPLGATLLAASRIFRGEWSNFKIKLPSIAGAVWGKSTQVPLAVNRRKRHNLSIPQKNSRSFVRDDRMTKIQQAKIVHKQETTKIKVVAAE
jgi:hypothetical protein